MASSDGGSWRIRLVAYGARLESVLGASPRGFESPILRGTTTTIQSTSCTRSTVNRGIPVSSTPTTGSIPVAGLRVRVRPRISLLRNGIVAALAAGIPIFVVLYWLGIERGAWMTVLGLHAVVTFICLIFVWRHLVAFAEVRDGVLRKQAFSTRTSVPVASIDRIVLAETYRGHSTETIPQLIVLDAQNRRVMRMRGHYWSAEDMRSIADATGARVLVESDPLSTNQYYALFDGTAYWYEGKPWLTITAIVLAVGAGLGLMLLLMHLLGMDLAGRS